MYMDGFCDGFGWMLMDLLIFMDMDGFGWICTGF